MQPNMTTRESVNRAAAEHAPAIAASFGITARSLGVMLLATRDCEGGTGDEPGVGDRGGHPVPGNPRDLNQVLAIRHANGPSIGPFQHNLGYKEGRSWQPAGTGLLVDEYWTIDDFYDGDVTVNERGPLYAEALANLDNIVADARERVERDGDEASVFWRTIVRQAQRIADGDAPPRAAERLAVFSVQKSAAVYSDHTWTPGVARAEKLVDAWSRALPPQEKLEPPTLVDTYGELPDDTGPADEPQHWTATATVRSAPRFSDRDSGEAPQPRRARVKQKVKAAGKVSGGKGGTAAAAVATVPTLALASEVIETVGVADMPHFDAYTPLLIGLGVLALGALLIGIAPWVLNKFGWHREAAQVEELRGVALEYGRDAASAAARDAGQDLIRQLNDELRQARPEDAVEVLRWLHRRR